MTKIYHIEESLEREHQGFERNNRFYTDTLHASELKRIGFETTEEKELQRSDIDLVAIINGTQVSISEKDRDVDYNDILIEFYSIYPTVRGWMDNSKAQYLAYFMPKRVFWINKLKLVDFYNLELRKLPVESYFNDLIKTNRIRSSATIEILGKNEYLNFIAAPNSDYVTMSISISLNLLKRAGVEFREYSLV